MKSQLTRRNYTSPTSIVMTKSLYENSQQSLKAKSVDYPKSLRLMTLNNGCETMVCYNKVYYSSAQSRILGLTVNGQYLSHLGSWIPKRTHIVQFWNFWKKTGLGIKKGVVTTITTPVNNMTKTKVARQRFGQDKFMDSLEESYRLFLIDQEYICNALKNERNLPKDMPALINLVDLFKAKYQHMQNNSMSDAIKFQIKLIEEQLQEMTIKFYKYFFNGQEKPIIIEAVSKQSAHYALEKIMPKLSEKGYDLRDLKDMKVENPLVGVNRKQYQGKSYVWSVEGWIEDTEAK